MSYSTKAIKLNLGCGPRYHSDGSWDNADFTASPPFVHKIDLKKGIPFKDSTFEFIYTSHVLDHFNLKTAAFILREIHRCLRPNGVLRISVPDLEFNCRQYLKSVEENALMPERHHWVMIELLDQMTRTRPGGEKAEFLRAVRNGGDVTLQQWLRPLLGAEMLSHLDCDIDYSVNLLTRLKQRIKKILGLNAFDRSGERHYWVYDWVSLSNMLSKAGFTGLTRQSYNSSLYRVFKTENLDIHNAKEYKPGSLYIEGMKK